VLLRWLCTFGCNPVLCRRCREAAIAYYYPQRDTASLTLRCMLLDEELDGAQVVAAHIYQIHWGRQIAVSRPWQQACEVWSVCEVLFAWWCVPQRQGFCAGDGCILCSVREVFTGCRALPQDLARKQV
jgi:hypothetical protein